MKRLALHYPLEHDPLRSQLICGNKSDTVYCFLTGKALGPITTGN